MKSLSIPKIICLTVIIAAIAIVGISLVSTNYALGVHDQSITTEQAKALINEIIAVQPTDFAALDIVLNEWLTVISNHLNIAKTDDKTHQALNDFLEFQEATDVIGYDGMNNEFVICSGCFSPVINAITNAAQRNNLLCLSDQSEQNAEAVAEWIITSDLFAVDLDLFSPDPLCPLVDILYNLADPLPNFISRCVTSEFGPRPSFGDIHGGTDFGAEEKTPVFAMHDGFVDPMRYGYDSSGGWRVWITTPDGVVATGYFHLSEKPIVNPGDPVFAGDQIGTTGTTGMRITEPHLQIIFEIGSIRKNVQVVTGPVPLCDKKNNDDNPEGESGPIGPSTSSTKTIEVVGSIDPNEKVGPNGFGPQGYIKDGQVLVYTVLFENLPAATAEALKVVITDQLDNDLDFTTFKTISSSHLDVLTTDIDTQTGLVTWTFSNINLPPNVNPPEGEGFVTYSINQKQNLPSGTEITNGASIVFDFNLPIVTNQVLNTIDSLAPTSSMQTLADTQNSQSFTVGWTGTDVDSGIKDFTIFVSQDEGPFTIFRDKTTQTSDVFTGLVESTYSFFSLTKDNVGNIQVSPTNTVQTTIVSAGVPLQPIIISPADGATITTTDLTIIGTAAAAATVKVFDVASSLGTTTALDDGAWFLSLTLAEGAHTLTATQTTSGGTSAESAPINITIDTVPPSSFTAWTQKVLDLRLTRSLEFQDIFPVGNDSEVDRLLAWAGNPIVQANNPELQEFGHLYSIMKRWNERVDLQIAFPGANLAENPVNLVIWSGRANVLANAFNSDLVPHEPTYVLLRIFFLERDDLRANPVFEGALDASDPSRLYCFAANSSDVRLTPHSQFYTDNCVL